MRQAVEAYLTATALNRKRTAKALAGASFRGDAIAIA
jgi:hypothetical protein